MEELGGVWPGLGKMRCATKCSPIRGVEDRRIRRMNRGGGCARYDTLGWCLNTKEDESEMKWGRSECSVGSREMQQALCCACSCGDGTRSRRWRGGARLDAQEMAGALECI